METINIFADNNMDPSAATFLVILVDLLFVGSFVFALRQYLAARRNAEQAKQLGRERSELRQGLRFVSGTVELAKDAKYAVRVTIEQEGYENYGKNSSFGFREVDRKVDATPFYLKHSSGKRIRIETQGADIVLVDKLDQRHWVTRTQRWVRAELTPNEEVIVEGELQAGHDPEAQDSGNGYRDSAQGWVMKPRDMTLRFCTEGLGHRHELRANALGKLLFLIPLLWAAAQVPLVTYRLRQLIGQDVETQYLGRSTWTTRTSKGGTVYHYAADVISPHMREQGDTERIDIDSSDYYGLPSEGGQKIWVRYVPGHPMALILGKGNSLHAGLWTVAAIIAAIAAGRTAYVHRRRRWYEGPYEQSGSGLLPQPSGERFASDPRFEETHKRPWA